MSTIYCKLKGGLANMLFQIAGTLGIARKYSLNFSFPNLNEHLIYLNQDNFYNANLKHAEAYKLILGKINQTPPSTNQLKYVHYPFQYAEIPLNNQDYLIEGFFQSEKYFINVRNELLDLFEEPSIIQKIIDEKYPQYGARTTSIHVRRGDYLKNPNYHPTQPMLYYETAMDILKNDTDYFLVFSDDIEWCKNNITGDNIIYIDSEIDYIELYLMARCNNNIIANSSFSWWGAWLNKNENKKVVAPTLWFGQIVGENTNDIIPENWIKI
jgi:hypothetical protein